MVNKEYYLQVLKRLREVVRRKRPDLWKGNKWLLYHVNAPVHSSLLICDFLTKHQMTLVLQRPCSPDLADFFLFTKLKSLLKGRRLESVKEIKECCRRATQYCERVVPRMLLKLEEMLGVMHKKWRRVLRRGRSRMALK
jgi:hypothetical protein